MSAPESRLHRRILLGLLLGAAVGCAVNALLPADPRPGVGGVAGGWAMTRVDPTPGWLSWSLRNVFDPIGQVFLRLLFMTVVPLVFASLAVGVAKLGGMGSLGRVGAKTFGYFLITSTSAVVIGLVLVNTVRPGVGLSEQTRTQLESTFRAQASEKLATPTTFGVQTFVDIVPRNPIQAAAEMQMLSVIFFALLVGIGVTRIPEKHGQQLLTVIEAIGEVMVFIIGLAMRLAPFGVFALIFGTTARFGFGLLQQLGMYVLVVLSGLAVQMFVVFPVLVKFLGGRDPWEFFRRVKAIIVTAFSTSSSNATLPTSIRVAQEELNVPPPIAGFVLPLGATMNMNGTALFEGVTVVFLAQVFGVPLDLPTQIVVVALCVLTAIGAAGVPGGSIPLLVMVLDAAGVPAGGIALILGVDRLLDMCRTTVNVVGDVTCAVYVQRSEGRSPPIAESGTA